jgi:RNA polymerase sigma-70 factor, ECF subfamily
MADASPTNEHHSTAVAADSFDAIVGPHLEVLLRVAGSLSHNSADAEDLVQDTLLRAFKSIATFQGPSPRAWLFTIMRNANINNHRRQRPALLRRAGDDVTDADRRNPSAPSAEDIATASTPAPWITEALDRLSPRLRQVVELVDIDGLTYHEAATLLAVPVGTVMSRLHRARHRMRAYLISDPDFRNGHP